MWYDYIAYKPAREQARNYTDAHGKSVVFEKGHDGWTLKQFTEQLHMKGVRLEEVEVAVLRMYTFEFYKPWNNALRGLDENGHKKADAIDQWATCIAVLCGALVKLSRAVPAARYPYVYRVRQATISGSNAPVWRPFPLASSLASRSGRLRS